MTTRRFLKLSFAWPAAAFVIYGAMNGPATADAAEVDKCDAVASRSVKEATEFIDENLRAIVATFTRLKPGTTRRVCAQVAEVQSGLPGRWPQHLPAQA